MQVDRQPSRWPCVVMLIGLVFFCLIIPRFWRKPIIDVSTSKQDHAPERLEVASKNSAQSVLAPFRITPENGKYSFGFAKHNSTNTPAAFVLDNDLLSLWAPPTLEELIATRFGRAQLEKAADHSPRIGPFVIIDDVRASIVAADPRVIAALDRVGRATVLYAPTEQLSRLTAKAVCVYHAWSTQHVAPQDRVASANRLRILGPTNRLAMRPSDENRVPLRLPLQDATNEERDTDPWCVPDMLIEQLKRIAAHPEGAAWADQTLVELMTLVNRESLEGHDVRTILATLCDCAQEAVCLADGTSDDRLRVELLRAHWALARRLDRWLVMHEIRIAVDRGDRFAARGSLGTYFDGAPDETRAEAHDLTLALENYERSRDPRLARQIIDEKRMLEASSDSLDRNLADAVEQHYRNANIRVAISAELINRFVDEHKSEVRPVRDRIGGASVRGSSHVQSSSRVKLEPATGLWDMGIESQGTVESNSLADGGPARFRSKMDTEFAVRKRVVVDANGVLLQPASVDVDCQSRLVGVTTDVDWVPLVWSYARERALQQYRARQPRARIEVESRVASEAVSTLDQKTKEAVERIESRIRERVTDRLAHYGVKVTPVEMTTTHQRVVARLRVASDEQPGSHTPRPRALSDSLASMQVHETALTNAAIGLELNGRQYTAAELAELFHRKFPNATIRKLDDEQRDTVFEFAENDAVQFRIEDGRLEVALTMASVEVDGRRMRNFIVHAFYAPAVRGIEAELVRDGSLGIEGRLSSGDRARLHNVFNAVLPPERTVPLVRFDDEENRLDGLMITQLVLEDGWLGLAIGPETDERIAERSRSLR